MHGIYLHTVSYRTCICHSLTWAGSVQTAEASNNETGWWHTSTYLCLQLAVWLLTAHHCYLTAASEADNCSRVKRKQQRYGTDARESCVCSLERTFSLRQLQHAQYSTAAVNVSIHLLISASLSRKQLGLSDKHLYDIHFHFKPHVHRKSNKKLIKRWDSERELL